MLGMSELRTGVTRPPGSTGSSTWSSATRRTRATTSHPIGMTMQFPVADQTKVNEPLLAQPRRVDLARLRRREFADGRHPMAPGSPPSRWFADPPVSGRHEDRHHRHRPLRARPGRRAVGMEVVPARPPPDPHGLRAHRRRSSRRSSHRPTPGSRPSSSTSLRDSRWATPVATPSASSLIDMMPRGELASTGYALANPGTEYLVLQPTAPVRRSPSTWRPAGTRSSGSKWPGERRRGDPIVEIVEAGAAPFRAPFTGPAVLYLRRGE